MGLYLCIVDADDDELDGVEIGHYSDFGAFRRAVAEFASPRPGRRLVRRRQPIAHPVLMTHSECDGEWTPPESEALIRELAEIRTAFEALPARAFGADSWQRDVG